jgi:hypothetical protein
MPAPTDIQSRVATFRAALSRFDDQAVEFDENLNPQYLQKYCRPSDLAGVGKQVANFLDELARIVKEQAILITELQEWVARLERVRPK